MLAKSVNEFNDEYSGPQFNSAHLHKFSQHLHICPITGRFLILPKGTDGWEKLNPYNASLDRIDNSKGYIKGNVRYIAYIANLGRSAFSDDQLISFCKVVATHQN